MRERPTTCGAELAYRFPPRFKQWRFVLALTDENGRWSKPSAIDSSAGFDGVPCPTTMFCVAITSDAVLFYNGSRWSAPRTISGKVQFTSISRPTTKFRATAGRNDLPTGTAAYVQTYAAHS